jgi:hypothetical protein
MKSTSSTFLDVAYLEVKQNLFEASHYRPPFSGAMRGRKRFLATGENEAYPALWLG